MTRIGPDAVRKSSTANVANDVVTVGAASTEVLAANPQRVEAFISNTHASQDLDLSLGGTAVAGEGIRVEAGEVVQITSFTGQINGIGSGAGTTVAIAEV